MERNRNKWMIGAAKRFPATLLVVLIFVYLLAPLIVLIWTSFGSEAFPTFPPKTYSLRWYSSFLKNAQFMNSLYLSFHVAIWATLLSLVIGVPASFALVRFRFRGSSLLNTLCMSPILFPGVVIGIALLVFYSKARLSSSFAGLVCAHVILATPFVIRLVSASLYGLGRSLEEASLNLGAGRLKTFFLITMPLIKPGMIAGGLFAFFTSFDEVTVTLFIAGAKNTTLPMRLYTFVEYSSDPTIAAISAFLILMALCLGVPVGWKFLGIRR
jgi:putative spermidine/putrescine transport system permease protein